MSFFPAMINFEDKKILIVGGGVVASHKLEKLLDFTKNITIISSKIDEKMQTLSKEYKLKNIVKKYQDNDALGFDVIIVCVDDLDLQEKIFKQTRSTRTLVNSVDSPLWCDFIFPSYIKKEELVISVSSSSYAPALSRAMRIYLEKFIPKDINILLQKLKNIRSNEKKGKIRQNKLSNLVNNFFKELN